MPSSSPAESGERTGRLERQLADQGIARIPFAVAGEPEVATIERGVAAAREAGCDCVIGIGGGSVLDAAKAIAALIANTGGVLDYLEIIGRGRPLARAPLPCIAIPTTAGTGSEVTRNAVLASSEHRVKVSLRSRLMLPRVALVDPDLTLTLPPGITASTGLDALTQLIEGYLSRRAGPLTDALALDGIHRAAGALRRAFCDGADVDARQEMALASLFSGLVLANAGLGAVHGIAGPFGGMFGAPHGAVCAALLPHAMRANLQALDARAPRHPARERVAVVARLLCGRDSASGADGVAWLQDLVHELRIPPLGTYGLTRDAIGALVEQSARASSMKGNPIDLTPAELAEIVERAL